ncbi:MULTISPECIES: VOC family protein [Cohnella]|uniref:VOC family protein n=1 Tax=Cohnella TaxID=329857 RepID=UPI0009B9EDEE|nr:MULTISPECIES: VOC family protein [Cohnella]MBN2980329.1 VOC family protein [Cohnella algarum]
MANRIHPETEIGNVHLRVSHLQRSIQYYEEVIGFKLLKREGSVAQLTAEGGTEPLLIIEELSGAVATERRRTAGLYHFAILVPTRKALGLSVRNLARRNVPIGQGDHFVSEAIYLNDPDGNGIEIYADRPRETWNYTASGEVAMGTEAVDIRGLLALAGDDEWAGLPAGTKIGHIHLHVSHLSEAREFYCDVLGFGLMANYGGSALFVSAGGYHHHIGLNVWAGVGAPPAPDNAPGLDFYTIAFASREALEPTLASIREAGIAVAEQDGGWLVEDPSRNRLLLVVK